MPWSSLSRREARPDHQHLHPDQHGLEPQLLAYLARFGLRFGCFDFAVDHNGDPWFLECNANGQWAWLEPEAGLPMTAAFADAVEGNP